MSPTVPDEKFLSALSDVVWRFYAYDQYNKDPEKAIRALIRRVPGYPPEFYLEQFELHLKLLIATIAAVQEAPKHFQPENKYSQFTDVDQSYVMEKLREAFPEHADDYLKGYLDMVIYWYYLR